VTADFTAGGQVVQSNYSYVDTTDVTEQGDPGTSQTFSVVGNPHLSRRGSLRFMQFAGAVLQGAHPLPRLPHRGHVSS